MVSLAIFALVDLSGRRRILSRETEQLEQATGVAHRPPQRRQDEIGIVDQVPFAVDTRLHRWKARARRATERLRLGRPQQGHRHVPIEQAMEAVAGGALPAGGAAMTDAPRRCARRPAMLGWRRGRARREDADRVPAGERAAAGGAAGHRRHRAPGRPRRRPGCRSATAPGKPVRLESLLHRGKPVLVTLGYHRCPMLCGLVLDGLVKALQRRRASSWARTSSRVDVSIDPDEDAQAAGADAEACPATLAGGAPTRPRLAVPGRRRSDGGAAARTLADAVGFRYKYDPTSKQFAHDAVAFVLTPEGVVARYLYGVDFRPATSAWRWSRRAAAASERPSTRCCCPAYRYDPVDREYAPFVSASCGSARALVFLALVGLLTVLWRKELAMKRQRARQRRVG